MEKRDLYDSNRNLTGETIYKGEQTPDGKFIVVVLIFIQNSEGKFLIQKEEVESLHWFSIDEINKLMDEGKFFKNHYEEFEILISWLDKKIVN